MFGVASVPQQENHGTPPHYIIIAPGRRMVPGKVWKLMKMMGHQNLSTLHRYILPGQEDYDQALNTMVTDMIPNSAASGGQ